MEGELLRFGPFELDPARMELKRSGLVLRLSPQPLRILLLLVSRAGEIVTRDEIQLAIWGGETFVDFEHGISSAIRRIRFVLGDNAEAPRYVRTVPRAGYEFIAPVEHVARPGAIGNAPPPEVELPLPVQRNGRTGRMAAAALVVAVAAVVTFAVQLRSLAAADATTVAVQPFRWLGPALPGLDGRSFGEELHARLGTLPRQRIQFVDDDPRADVRIDGTIRQEEGRVRVIVSLVDTASRAQLWSETFDRGIDRRDGLPVEVAYRVMQQVARRFLPPARREALLVTDAPPRALAAYRQARLSREQMRGFQWTRARELYEAALKELPQFAEAWSGLSEVWANDALLAPMAEREHAARQARACARRALQLQPRNAEALATLGILAAQRDFDLAAAEQLYRRAAALDPGYLDAQVNLASVLAMRGKSDESLRAYDTARQLDPAFLDLNPIEPLLYLLARRYDDARARYRDALAIHPQATGPLWGILYTYIAQRRWSEATAMARTIRGLPAGEGPYTETEFRSEFRALETKVTNDYQAGAISHYFAAIYFAQLDDRERAFDALNAAVDARLPLVSYLRVDPRFDTLRTDARFNQLLIRANLGRQLEQVALSQIDRK